METKTAQFTPGPWRIGEHRESLGGTDWVEIVTDALPFKPSYVSCALKQDARLIAAAPDLLEALEALLDQADMGEVDEETQPIVDAARAAIASARGQQ